MNILVISHNVFSNNDNMGKTLSSYFKNYNPDSIAQFYIHNSEPQVEVSKNYFRITDKEAIQSLLGFSCGRAFTQIDNKENQTGYIISRLYNTGRKRTPSIYFLRNLWWKFSNWNNPRFNKWVDDFKPDCVFLAAGDYAFIYDIALSVAKSRSIPLYITCFDDYFLYNSNNKKFGGNLYHKYFMKHVNNAVNYTKCIFCICEKMSQDYTKLFGKKCYTLYTSNDIEHYQGTVKLKKISFLGNLSLGRYKQIITIGKTLKSMKLDIDHVDVYSAEQNPYILKEMVPQNGINFHGKVDFDSVQKIICESTAVIHVESFDNEIENRVRYSLSTKIADSLASGTPILAFGPRNIASMDYLINNNAAFYASNIDELKKVLHQLITNENARDFISKNALKLAEKNHTKDSASLLLKSIIG